MFFFLCFFFFIFMLSPSLLKLLHLQSNKHIQKHKDNKTTRRQNIKHRQKQKSSSRNLRDMYSRSGRGLDILSILCRKLEQLEKLENDAQRFFAESWKSWKNWKNDAQSFSPTINMCYRVWFCIIIYKCDRFACTS